MSWEGRHHALMMVWRWFAIDFDQYQRQRGTIPGTLQAARETHGSLISRREIEDFCREMPRNLIDFPAFEIRPPNHSGQAIAVLKLEWRHEGGREHCLFNYGAWSMMTLPETVRIIDTPNKRQIPIFTGFRFETPEMGGNHAYHHSQPSRNLGDGDAPEVREALELSVYNPTWPMAARDTVQLALCVVLSLYGFEGFDRFKAYAQSAARAPARRALNQAIDAVSGFQMIN